MTTLAVAVVLLLGSVSIVAAREDGVATSQAPSDGWLYFSPMTDLIEAWNDNGQPPYPGTYSSLCFAYQYVPSQDYVLERIEWFTGDIGGTVTTSVREGAMNGPELASVTYDEVPPQQWQGADLVPSISVTTGSTYFIIYQPVGGAAISAAASGDPISHWHDPSGTCQSFNGPYSLPWRARFYGTVGVPVEAGTWGNVKSLYR
jgi:hypothetical protein